MSSIMVPYTTEGLYERNESVYLRDVNTFFYVINDDKQKSRKMEEIEQYLNIEIKQFIVTGKNREETQDKVDINELNQEEKADEDFADFSSFSDIGEQQDKKET